MPPVMTKKEIIDYLVLKYDPTPSELRELKDLTVEDLRHPIRRDPVDRDDPKAYRPLRFVEDDLMRWIKDNTNISMEKLVKSGLDDMYVRRFYRDIGYSIGGFLEIFGK